MLRLLWMKRKKIRAEQFCSALLYSARPRRRIHFTVENQVVQNYTFLSHKSLDTLSAETSGCA